MSEPARPLWLAQPSRFRRLPPVRARIVAALLALWLAVCLTATLAPAPPPVSHDPAQRADDQADVMLYETIVAGIRGGGDYYAVAADALRRGDFPLKPFVTFRLPTLAVIEAALPPPVTMGLLYALVAAVAAAWTLRLRPALTRTPPLLIALVLLAGGLIAFVQADLAAFHEVWAGLLVALSLALRRPGRWVAAVAVGTSAMLIRETAAIFALAMFACAWIEGERREAAGWVVAVGALALATIAHAHAVGEVVRATDPASPGWAGMLGPGFFVRAIGLSTALMLAPVWLAALIAGLSLFGWASWRDPLALRAFLTLALYGVVLSLFGRADTFYWALMVAPIALVGLVFVPDGLRDLLAAAGARTRRITVRRVAR